MIRLIADSGSTKTDWRIIDQGGQIRQAKTSGFNPYYSAVGAFQEEIKSSLLPHLNPKEVSTVFYYGAGCSSEENIKIIKDMFRGQFPKAEVEVNHDLLAAARALCGKDNGVACILGTGSNSGLYNGQDVIHNIPSLAYVLGDFGSGSTMGKELLSAYFHHQLPETLKREFDERFNLNRHEMLHSIYKKPMAATYLASFSPFLLEHSHDSFVYELITNQFKKFLTYYVLPYDGVKNIKVHFTGSVAFHYQNILREVVADLGLVVGNILETPIAGLTLYHQES